MNIQQSLGKLLEKVLRGGRVATMPDLVSCDFGVTDHKGVPRVSSRYVAAVFGKEHKNVLRAVENLDCSTDFARLNFEPSSYKNDQNKKQPEYLMTRDGFTFLAMGFTGKKAAQFKEAYIAEFNRMEQFIKSRHQARLENLDLNRNIKSAHDPVKHYHFSNEADLINRIVLGMSAKEFRILHGIDKDKPIRDYMTPFQIQATQKLQNFDTGLVIAVPDFQKRKELLTEYFNQLQKLLALPETGS